MSEPSRDQEMSPPPDKWWLQRSLLVAEAIGVLAVVAGVLVVLAPWSDFVRGLVGGALLGLGATTVVGVPFATREAWEQQWRDYRVWRATKDMVDPYVTLFRARTVTAFYLGVDARMLTANADAVPERLAIARRRCAMSGITFSDKEMKLLGRSNPTLKVATHISDLIAEKAQQRGRDEWTFFRLGQLVGAIVPHLEASRPIQPITRQVDRLLADRFIQLDPRFPTVISGLLSDLSGFDETVGGEPRQLMIGQVIQLLSRLPSPEIDTYGQDSERFLILEDEWYWTQDENGDGIPICFSAGYVLTAQADWEYEISRESPAHEAKVARSGGAWACSLHGAATDDAPCFDIRLVFDHTDGGTPVHQARTILVSDGAPDDDS